MIAMVIRRHLTTDERAARRRAAPGLRGGPAGLNALHTFLTDEERELVTSSVDAGETVQEFIERISDNPDREVLAKEQERVQSARLRAARRRDLTTARDTEDAAVRERQPVSPTNPYGAYLDPRHDDLPEYPRSPAGVAQQKRLREAATDYRDTANVLVQAMNDVADAFAAAFAREDSKRAVRDRINRASADNIQNNHDRRVARLG